MPSAMGHDKSISEAITQIGADDGESGGSEGDRLMGSYQHTPGPAPYATTEHLKRYIPSLSLDYNTGQTTTEWLGQYLPFLKPQEDAKKKRGDPMSKRAEMLRNQALIAICVVALNVAITAWAVVSYRPDEHGVGTFYTGSCPTATAVNSAAHVVLNVLSTAFLGAGNYCMQIMVAPSREELNKAHAKGKALEIGVPSLKNLLRISRKRVACWITLGIFATTLHVFWNSAIFTSLPTVFIPRAVVTSDFLNATDNWTLEDPVARLERGRWWEQETQSRRREVNSTVIYGMQAPAKEKFTRLSTRECIRTFIEPMSATRALVVVAKNMTSEQNEGSSLIDAAVFGWNADSSWASAWICLAYQRREPWDFCTWEWAQREFADNWELQEPPVQVDSCLVGEAGDNSERCGLHYSTHVMGIVCGCTLIEFLLIIGIWFQQHRLARADDPDKRTMTTLGDAIHSYLDDTGHETYENPPPPGMWGIRVAKWAPREGGVSWFKAVTMGAWIRAMTLFVVAIVVFSYFIGSSASSARATGIDLSPEVLWNHGFGVHPALTAGSLGPLNDMGLSSTALMLWQILITNAAQVIISLLYIFYNSIFTRQLVADEWVRFLGEDGKKVLRVSAPRGMQRSTYFLSLPAKYSVPLMAMSTAMHWLISQSIYLVQTRAYGPGLNSERIPSFDHTGRGYSVLGSVLALLFGGLVVAIMLINSGVRRYRGIPDGFQLMAYNSSGIQAMCQRPEGDREAGFFPIRMGVTTGAGEGCLNKAAPRLTFSTDINLTAPEPGEKYYQPVLKQRKRWWAWRSRRNVGEED